MLLSRYVVLIEGIRSGMHSVQRNVCNEYVFLHNFLTFAIVSIAMLVHWKAKASAVCNSLTAYQRIYMI